MDTPVASFSRTKIALLFSLPAFIFLIPSEISKMLSAMISVGISFSGWRTSTFVFIFSFRLGSPGRLAGSGFSKG